MLEIVGERLIDSAIDTSYQYVGKHATYGVKILRQDVKNEIEGLISYGKSSKSDCWKR